MSKKQLSFRATNHTANHKLVEMELWPPQQGAVAECFPIELDLVFDSETFRTPHSEIEVTLTGCTVQLVLENCSVVRGSRLGDEINDPYEIAEVTLSASEALESLGETGAKLDASISKSLLGKLSVYFSKYRKNRKSREDDRMIKKSTRVHRIVPRTGLRWDVNEPIPPHILKGRFLGEVVKDDGREKSRPICLVLAQQSGAKVKVYLRIKEKDLHVAASSLNRQRLGTNKELIIRQIASNHLIESMGLQPDGGEGAVTICYGEVVCDEDD